ncbi:MAG: hypothetical protein NMNS01_28380 [Nitrosomonas sp.]|nr:MAG: hypothetical protein NMNS01_28380 [Nitrosomonas sp.]
MYPTIDTVTRFAVTTKEAAYYLNRKPQTLREWSCLQTGPIHPIKIGNRLAWRVKDIKKLLGY